MNVTGKVWDAAEHFYFFTTPPASTLDEVFANLLTGELPDTITGSTVGVVTAFSDEFLADAFLTTLQKDGFGYIKFPVPRGAPLRKFLGELRRRGHEYLGLNPGARLASLVVIAEEC